MVQASPRLCSRLRFTTKGVGRGFYRGTGTGSMGAHTEYGGYVIDWRKVRSYNMPNLKDFKLTPFVTLEMQPTPRTSVNADTNTTMTPKKVDPMEFLRTWKIQNPDEYEQVRQFQQARREAAALKETEAAMRKADNEIKRRFRKIDGEMEEVSSEMREVRKSVQKMSGQRGRRKEEEVSGTGESES